MREALIIIDMLNDFVTGPLKTENAAKIIPKIKSLIQKARENGIPVIYSNDAHLPNIDGEFDKWGPHAIKGTEGAEVIEELKPNEGDYIIEKRRYSGFYQTDLDMLLRELKVETVILTGLHTHICVKHTAADAFFRGYKVIVVEDCTGAFTLEDHLDGLKYMKNIYGVEIVKSSDILKAIEGGD